MIWLKVFPGIPKSAWTCLECPGKFCEIMDAPPAKKLNAALGVEMTRCELMSLAWQNLLPNCAALWPNFWGETKHELCVAWAKMKGMGMVTMRVDK